jgi:hypothetical protein
MKKASLPPTAITFVAIAACIGSVFGLLAFIFGTIKANTAYRLGMGLVKNDPAVIELLGSPVKDGFFVAGTIREFHFGGGYANLETSISGPRAHGTVCIYGTEHLNGVWQIDSLDIRVGGKIVLTYNGYEQDKEFHPPP